MTPEQCVAELYRGIFDREPDQAGLEYYSWLMGEGKPLHEIVRQLIGSDEFRNGGRSHPLKQADLPDITPMLTRPLETIVGLDNLTHHVFAIEDDAEFTLLEQLIVDYRFYDYFGGWGYSIDLDKKVIAGIVKGLGARNCLEVGCSNGPVLSLLHDAGVNVTGIDLSHLAFTLAYPNIRNRLVYGDLLSANLDRTYDVVLAMDIFEHINPLKLGDHLDRAAALMDRDGYLVVNSPMFGPDALFGTPFPLFLPQWRDEPQDTFWRHIPCDAKGWPWDGHLVWAPTTYWEHQFMSRGLERDQTIEAALQHILDHYFRTYAPERRAIFVLKRPGNQRQSSEVASQLSEAVSMVDGVNAVRM